MLYLRQLSAEENNRSGQHRAAYDVLAWGLWRESGIRHAWLERQDRGKPFLPMYPQVHVNVTHCRFLAAAAVDAAPVGVDAEPVRPLRERVLERACARGEQDWVLSHPVVDGEGELCKGNRHRHRGAPPGSHLHPDGGEHPEPDERRVHPAAATGACNYNLS